MVHQIPVQVLQGVAFPEVLEPGDPQVNVTYVLPDEAMQEVQFQD